MKTVNQLDWGWGWGWKLTFLAIDPFKIRDTSREIMK